jgi:hypothetical protein
VHCPTFNGTDITSGSLTGADVKDHSLTAKDVKGSVRGIPWPNPDRRAWPAPRVHWALLGQQAQRARTVRPGVRGLRASRATLEASRAWR